MDLRERYRRTRTRTVALTAPLELEDLVVQSMEDASPVRWHLAHTTWFFDVFVLEGRSPFVRPHPDYRMLFNSYYVEVGARFARPRRGSLSRPTVREVLAYRDAVDAAMDALLVARGPEVAAVVELGLQHEEQHQELILTDVKHALGTHPSRPVYQARAVPRARAPRGGFVDVAGGVFEIGHDDGGGAFAFDNERPRHRVLVEDFRVARDLVTVGEYRAFMEDGGYDDPRLWLDDGWAWKTREQIAAPLYWASEAGARGVYTLHGVVDDDAAPVCHVSFFEADAYARWAGHRLATEAEWERAATTIAGERGGFLDDGVLHPSGAVDDGARGDDVGRGEDARLDDDGARALFGDVWEWTESAYLPYPGFRPLPGALGEYNGKFMNGQRVLRGGSVATPRGHIRPSYRNFFQPEKRWQFTGIRLAADAPGGRPGAAAARRGT